MNSLCKAIFLDRDGVINRKAPEGSYIADLSEVELLPGSLKAIAELYRHGWLIFLVTNQRGIARGMISKQLVEEIHHWLSEQVIRTGGRITGVYVCAHDYVDFCNCRKPNPGMLLQAAREHSIDLEHSWMVGDSLTDMQAGRAAGCKTAYLGQGKCEIADVQAPSLMVFAQRLLQGSKKHSPRT